MCVGSEKNALLIFLIPLNQVSLTRPAVLMLTAVWYFRGRGHRVWLTALPAIVSDLSGYVVLHFLCAWAAVMSSRIQSCTLCLDVSLNIRVFIFSHRLSCWGRCGLLKFFQGNVPHNLHKYVYPSRLLCVILLVLSILTVFVCVHYIFLTDQRCAWKWHFPAVIINYLFGILVWNFTDTFWKHPRLILHIVKRGIIGSL